MRVCIPSLDPGGPDGVAAASFEETEVFDFYDVHPDGNFERFAQTRPCACWGPDQAEAVSRRGIEAIIVEGISPSALLKFSTAGVRVLRVDNPSVAALLDSFAAGRLDEIRIDQFARLRKKKGKD
jgi:predicted Fe-Mo cluster-binding NifX family protein